jgi:hypothetical protein
MMDWDEDEIENAFVEWDESLSATVREIAMSSPRVLARLAWRAAWIAALQRANPTIAGETDGATAPKASGQAPADVLAGDGDLPEPPASKANR